MWLLLIPIAGLITYTLLSAKPKLLTTLKIHAPIGSSASMATQVATSGTAKPAADALFDRLKTAGNAASDALRTLVIAFQSANNTDPQAFLLAGPLDLNGHYDVKTSAALTIYTHDPIPASPEAPKPPPPTPEVIANVLIPGAAATSAFNLYTYLKKHRNDKSPTLHALTIQFQEDVNTDPKFAGPANALHLPKLVGKPLALTGVYDAATAAALKVATGDRIAP